MKTFVVTAGLIFTWTFAVGIMDKLLVNYANSKNTIEHEIEYKDPVLKATATSVIVNQEVTIQVEGDKTNCHKWSKVSGPDYIKVSGGGQKDKTWTLKFSSSGTVVIECKADYCIEVSHGGSCGHGCQGEKILQITINVKQ